MEPSSLALGWPGEPAIVVSAWRESEWHTLARHGDLEHPRAWASVTKLLVACATALELEEGRARLDDALGPVGSTLAHVLAHASGLGLEEGDPVVAPGTKRVYSNYGIDLAATHLARDIDVAAWITQRVLAPLSLDATTVAGRASEGAVGSTRDLSRFAREWVAPTLMTSQFRDATVVPRWPELSGIVPGFGRFEPCPWGLAVEIQGEKRHWMGDWPSKSFGHFGRSGTLLLANVQEGICVVATSTVAFGPWAYELWPAWTSHVRSVALRL